MSVWISIQYLRAAAALAVVWCHAYLELEKITAVQIPDWFNGRSGVDLFFVISGFIIWITTHDSGPSTLSFWYRRLIRILPLYWLCTLGMVVLLVVAPTLFDRPHLDLGHVIRSLLFIPHEDPLQPGEVYPLLQVGWTLNFEMFFYAVFGFCLLLQPAYRVLATVLLFGGLATIGTVLRSDHPILATYTDPLLLEFMAGVAIGYIFTSRWRPDAAFGYGLMMLAVLAYIGLNQGLTVEPIDWRVLCWGVPAALLIMGFTTVERASGVAKVPLLNLLGDASYAIYLSHPFTLGGLRWAFGNSTIAPDMPPAIFIGVAMLISLLVGLMLHLTVERPIIGWLRRWWRGRRSLPRAATLAIEGSHGR
jgi:exopolysaccharide production protein ExoZ